LQLGERLEQDMIAVPIGPRHQRFAVGAAPALETGFADNGTLPAADDTRMPRWMRTAKRSARLPSTTSAMTTFQSMWRSWGSQATTPETAKSQINGR